MARGPAWYRAKAGKRDANAKPIIKALEALGYLVADLGGAAGGIPDIAVCEAKWRNGTWVWIEIKMPGEPLTPAQTKLHTRWWRRGIEIHVVHSLDEALDVLR